MTVRTVLIALEVAIGFAAVAGGVYALLGAAGVPRAWLAGSPFSSYRLPGVVLLVIVGGTSLTAARLLLGDYSTARLLSFLAGVVLLAWAAAQMMYLSRRHWSQPLSALLGFAVAILALLLPAPG